jgi:simple sugar transport system ATP-binding protein
MRGEVHALLGENGSGKTTLCKMLTGIYRPDKGEIVVDGRPVKLSSPHDAAERGIVMVHQHFSLVERLTVAENVVIGDTRIARVTLNRRSLAREVALAAEKFQIAVNPDAYVWQLSLGEKQRVELLKALYRGARTIILDEPTTVLTPAECDGLFATLRDLTNAGSAIVFVSHKLREVLALCDRVTILRGGRNVATMDLREHDVDAHRLAELMVGRAISMQQPRQRRNGRGAPALELKGVSADGDLAAGAVADVELTVLEGEIVGIAGVAGNGQRELAEVIAGVRARTRGKVAVAGCEVANASPRASRVAGLGFVPEDRLGMGLAPGLPVADNVVLNGYRDKELWWGPLIRRQAVMERTSALLTRFDVRGRPDNLISQLSGGNAQRVLLARELASRPKVLIAAAPTRGLDVAATMTVRSMLRDAADEGVGVMLISEDLDEILELADRIAVMYEGRIVGVLHRDAATTSRLGAMMAGIEST